MKTCLYCGTPNEDAALVCCACGSELPKPAQTPPKTKKGFFGKKKARKEETLETVICPICAEENPAGEKTCACCGSELNAGNDSAMPKYCSVCGMENASSDTVCASCGSELAMMEAPSSQNSEKSRKGGRWMVWAAAAAVVVGLVAGGTALVMNTDEAQVYRGSSNLSNSFTQKLQKLQNLAGAKDHLQDLTKTGEYSVTLRIDTEEMDASAVVHYDVGDKIMDGTLSYTNQTSDVFLDFDFSADNEKFMLASDRLTADIYGFELEDFKKTPLAKLLPLPVNEDGELELFQEFDFQQQMENKFGTVWKKFIESVEYNEINERDMTVGDLTYHVRAFEVTWNTRALLNLVDEALGNNNGFLEGFADILVHLEPNCRIYISEDHEIVAMDFVAAGNKCLIEFAGVENPWEKILISSQAIGGGQGIISGWLYITDAGIDSQITLLDQTGYSFVYDDATGEFRFAAQVGKEIWDVTGKCTSENSSAAIEFYGLWGDEGQISVSVALEPLEKKPEHLAKKYVDLMDMNSGDWQRLLIELSN